ncbi:uncharacterized protein MKZ38_005422 [Zalerion maritima]|uniref:WSC domain-containing protein n=1 Tax=Zalerion maritima TaxID=339359 RepID=A0AAD5RR09_9PEZI|nr:uncharacterized protein MKZ38_005422 [Zalerion maritima]
MKSQSILLGLAMALVTKPGFAKDSTTATGSSSTATALSNEASEEPVIGQITNQGCFNSSGELKLVDDNLDFNSDGKCGTLCQDKDYPVGATTGGQECWCGDEYPPVDSLVDNDECNYACTGYDTIACGGLDTWSVYNTGVKLAVHNFEESSSSATSSGSSTSATSSSSTSQSSTSSSETSSSDDSSGSNSKTIGIVVGAVSAVLIVGGAVGGVLWYLRKKRNAEIEEEHRRNAAVNAFINGSNPPGSSHGSISMTDSRLDPVMAHRRMSDGSIADNQDYSRKILRVTNA